MLEKLKADFDGILELVQKCPPNLQDIALKTILEHWFITNAASPIRSQGGGQGLPTTPNAANSLPEAVKTFMTANGITIEVLTKSFHPTGPGAQLLVSDIPGMGKSQKQANLAFYTANSLAVREPG